ncbi:MAG TPA: Uma2 family endonuclease [Planctomycetota bacterium]|nr:Uma2 family endonuclease [Planctomycetota bacterium]
MTVAQQRRLWTYADYCRIPADRLRHEIIDGRHFVNPSPSPYHQTVSARLEYQLMRLVDLAGRGRVFHAPIDVHLGPRTLVVPDLVVLKPRSACVIGARKLSGAPDMVVEILSPSNRDYDRRRKKARYARAGVREYWIVDPDERLVEQFVLRARSYVLVATCRESIRLAVLRSVTIDLTEVW